MLPQLRSLLFSARPIKENLIKKKTDQYSDLIHTGYSEPLGDLSDLVLTLQDQPRTVILLKPSCKNINSESRDLYIPLSG